VVRFSQNHNCTVFHFCSYMCGVVYSLAKVITVSHLIFAITCMVQYGAVYKMRFEAHNIPVI